MKDRYVSCYISGRCDEYDDELPLEPLVEKVMSGQPLRDVAHAAAKAAIDKEMDVTTKAQWLQDNADEIKELGGDSGKAWRLYVQGRVDVLAANLEDEVVEHICEAEEPEEEEDEDEDDDEELDEEDDGDDGDSDDADDEDDEEEP